MTIALFISTNRMLEEHAMLHRLVVGLMNENKHVIRCLPKRVAGQFDANSHSAGLSEEFYFDMPCSFIERSSRRRKAISQMVNHQVEAMVAFGTDAQQLVLDVKKHLDIPVCVELTTLAQAARIRPSQSIDAWLAPTHSIHREATSRAGEERVAYAPFGTQRIAIQHNEPSIVRCIIVLDASGNLRQTELLLKQMQNQERLHLFLEFTHKHNNRVHRLFKANKLQERVTCLGNVSELRALIPSADALVLPNNQMPIRSIVLEAMSAGVPIVCSSNEAYDMLIDDETALFVTEHYDEQLERVLSDKHLSQVIVNNAHTLIEESYGSSKQIAAYDALFSLF
ncbi:MAG: glycosyltransferase [Planctomycetota bacterium]|nr:glycosyltransferase [Planctomycetota bacterium]